MKSLFLVFFLVPTIGFSQVGIKLGLTLPAGGNAGLMYNLQIGNSSFSFHPEVLFQIRNDIVLVEKSFKSRIVYKMEESRNLSSIVFPLNLKKEFGTGKIAPYVMLGLNPTIGISEFSRKFDIPVSATLGIRISKFSVDARYFYGLISSDDFRIQHDRYLSISVGYYFLTVKK